MTTRDVKLVVVGDGAVGKTCLLWVYARDTFPETYVPTVFDNTNCNTVVDGRTVNLGLWDTAGQEEYDRSVTLSLRPLSYPGSNIFLMCFSVVSSTSYQNIKKKWHPEVTHHMSNTPIILGSNAIVGTKIDLRDDANYVASLKNTGETTVSHQQGEQLKQQIKAIKYIESSAKKKFQIKLLFDEAVRTVLFPRKTSGKLSSACTLL
ncbi:Rho-related protein Rac [Acrasis kona]|uniref:Rho-related protein Rac n=1 Tax=Acrasis kona TaxID=1008807 RepID=A0AAW2YX16_9EUKA